MKFLPIKTDQKQVLFKAISKIIKEYNIKSLLDIGAGQPFLASKLNNIVENYLAVEYNTKFIKALKENHINVIEGRFPKNFPKNKFDLVLTSHSLPEDVRLYESFLKKAWDLVEPEGALVVITFIGSLNKDHDLIKELKINLNEEDDLKSLKILDVLSELNSVEIREIVSHSTISSLKDMIEFLSFMLGVDKEKLKKQKNAIIDKYKKGSEFIFPHKHIVYIIPKK